VEVEAMKIGAIVCKAGDTYYLTCEVDGMPSPSSGQTLVFSLDEDFDRPQTMFRKVRKEANQRNIGEIVNLPKV